MASSIIKNNDFLSELDSPNLDNVIFNFHGYVYSATNVPQNINQSGELIVVARKDKKRAIQIYSPHTTARIFTRSLYTEWTSWYEIQINLY